MKKILTSILIVLFMASPSFAAIAATTVWEIRQTATANNVNGGGFNASQTSAGTDYSLQDAAQLTLTDLAATGTALTSVTGGFTTAMVGNIIHITTTGTGAHFVVGWYEIVAYVNGNGVTLDRDPTTGGAGVAGTGNVGGAMSMNSTLDDDFTEIMVPGNIIYVKYSATPINTGEHVSTSAAGTATLPIYLTGYDTTRTVMNTDTNRPTINAGANYWTAGPYWKLRNLIGTTSSYPTFDVGNYGGMENIKGTNTSASAAGFGVACSGASAKCINIEGICGSCTGIKANSGALIGCYAHDSVVGIAVGGSNVKVLFSLVENNTTTGISLGATYDGIYLIGNTLYGVNSGDTGILANDSENNVIMNNSISNFATAVNFTGAEEKAGFHDYNNYGVSPTLTNYTGGPHDITVNPTFTDAAGGNYTPDTSLKAKAFPGVLPGSASTSYLDIGAVQRVEPAGGGGGAWGF